MGNFFKDYWSSLGGLGESLVGQGGGSRSGATGLSSNWQTVSKGMEQGKTNDQVLQDLLNSFQGRDHDLRQFMENPAYRASAAYGAKNTPEYQKLQNLQDPTLQSLNVGLGQISAAGARGVQDSLAGLNASGLGRNVGAQAAVQGAGQADTAGRSAVLQAGMQQQAYGNELQRLTTLIGMEQEMAQLALGFQPQPRQPSSGASTGDWIALAGTLIGGAFGAPWLGAAAGGAAGKAYDKGASTR